MYQVSRASETVLSTIKSRWREASRASKRRATRLRRREQLNTQTTTVVTRTRGRALSVEAHACPLDTELRLESGLCVVCLPASLHACSALYMAIFETLHVHEAHHDEALFIPCTAL
jgi:hypothetical protein